MLTKVCNVNFDDWDFRIPTVLGAYHTICKGLIGKTPFKLVYGKEVVMPMDYIVPNICIATMTGTDDGVVLEECSTYLLQPEEDRFIAGFHQCVEKDRWKAWHDDHINNKHFQQGDLVLLYDSKFMKNPGKLQMHWLGPYLANSIASGGVVQLQ